MNDHPDLARGLLFLVITLFLVLLTFACLVSAENLTAVVKTNVSVNCNNQSQCVIIPQGSAPVFFTANDYNTTISVTGSVSYEPVLVLNNTNVTYVVNSTNYTIITQNVSVMNCTPTPPINLSADEVSRAIAATVSANIGTACQAACGVSENDRNILQTAKSTCDSQLSVSQTACQSQLNISNGQYWQLVNTTTTQYEALNETCTLRLNNQEDKTNRWIILTIIILCLLVAAIVMFVYRSTNTKVISGKSTASIMPPPRNP